MEVIDRGFLSAIDSQESWPAIIGRSPDSTLFVEVMTKGAKIYPSDSNPFSRPIIEDSNKEFVLAGDGWTYLIQGMRVEVLGINQDGSMIRHNLESGVKRERFRPGVVIKCHKVPKDGMSMKFDGVSFYCTAISNWFRYLDRGSMWEPRFCKEFSLGVLKNAWGGYCGKLEFGGRQLGVDDAMGFMRNISDICCVFRGRVIPVGVMFYVYTPKGDMMYFELLSQDPRFNTRDSDTIDRNLERSILVLADEGLFKALEISIRNDNVLLMVRKLAGALRKHDSVLEYYEVLESIFENRGRESFDSLTRRVGKGLLERIVPVPSKSLKEWKKFVRNFRNKKAHSRNDHVDDLDIERWGDVIVSQLKFLLRAYVLKTLSVSDEAILDLVLEGKREFFGKDFRCEQVDGRERWISDSVGIGMKSY